MYLLFLLFAVAAGVTSALQSGTNNALQKALGTQLWTVSIVSLVTLTVSLLLSLATGERLPNGAAVAQAPWWAWTGGVLGIVFVLATVYASPRLGAGLFVALIVTASTVAALVLDHFGWMGFEIHQAGIARIAGAALMITGVALIAIF
ncbi:DMT family transporter [Sphingomonas sp. ac-8]|uniref:DMT family transporter n=1 Tax=Sphingomonas sp. ac-8 TaxID=3242977 RepID=UPI003A80E748